VKCIEAASKWLKGAKLAEEAGRFKAVEQEKAVWPPIYQNQICTPGKKQLKNFVGKVGGICYFMLCWDCVIWPRGGLAIPLGH
jgi:hypothetical protein